MIRIGKVIAPCRPFPQDGFCDQFVIENGRLVKGQWRRVRAWMSIDTNFVWCEEFKRVA